MNCTECGNALLLDRVIFRCSCGAYVHAYCADNHIVHAHRPDFEEGFVDLNGDFHLKKEPAVVAELPESEAEEESPEVVETSAAGEEDEEADEGSKEEEHEVIAPVAETPSDEGEVKAESSESEKQDASSE